MQGLHIRRDVSLQPYNSMAVAARASHLVTVATCVELQEAFSYATQQSLQPLVLGGGSNTLFSADYQGLVICNRLKGVEIIDDQPDSVDIKLGAGENWHQWVAYSLAHRWFGLENLALIPGLVGAAPIQNIGAYGAELRDTMIAVEYVDVDDRSLHTLSNTDCQFAYRDSIFKGALADKAAITSVTFRLSKTESLNLSYPELQKYFSERAAPGAQEVFEAVCEIRRQKLPLPEQIPNAGSFFKNPIVSDARLHDLKATYPNIVAFRHGDQSKLAAAWLIEQAGWKKRSVAGVSVHPDQALVIINPQHASARQVLDFAARIQQDIEEKFAIKLEVEPRIY